MKTSVARQPEALEGQLSVVHRKSLNDHSHIVPEGPCNVDSNTNIWHTGRLFRHCENVRNSPSLTLAVHGSNNSLDFRVNNIWKINEGHASWLAQQPFICCLIARTS